jgi:hypothetical protein
MDMTLNHAGREAWCHQLALKADNTTARTSQKPIAQLVDMMMVVLVMVITAVPRSARD